MDDKITLGEIESFFRKISVDDLKNIIVTTSTLVGVIVAPSVREAFQYLATGATLHSLKPRKIINWLKFVFNNKEKNKEESSIKRYKKIRFLYFLIIHISIRYALKQNLKDIKFFQTKYDLQIEKDINSKEITEKKIRKIELPQMLHKSEYFSSTDSINELFLPIIKFNENIDFDSNEIETLIAKISKSTETAYQSFLFHLCFEVPEFALWVNLEHQNKILLFNEKIFKTLKNYYKDRLHPELNKFIEFQDKILVNIKSLYDDYHDKHFSFDDFMLSSQYLFDRNLSTLKEILEENVYYKIKMHHSGILNYLEQPLSRNVDDQKAVIPEASQIFIPQSFEFIQYEKALHSKDMLIPENWKRFNGFHHGERIDNKIVKCLLDPHHSKLPILILGNPGSGKTMFCRFLAAKFCQPTNKIFVPFLIHLNKIESSHAKVDGHISEGLKETVIGGSDLDWMDWLLLFKDRIPVFILDGFDELLRASPTDLNRYFLDIIELQKKLIFIGISSRFIVSSRLTVMQDVAIPEYTTIIKINSFDKKRQEKWISKWNGIQTWNQFVPFRVPNNRHIEDLAKEPLLLFLLAIYDFKGASLQKMAAKKGFSRSKFYDALFTKFSIRQLKKIKGYCDLRSESRNLEILLFRLRFGLIAYLMFAEDRMYLTANELNNGLKQFGIRLPFCNDEKVFSEFFFVHEDKAKTEIGNKNYSFMFLHKTFGEFLAADFMLRNAFFHFKDYILVEDIPSDLKIFSEKESFKLVYGTNWLLKHPQITNFFFEHGKSIFQNSDRSKIIPLIIRFLKEIIDKNQLPFPINKKIGDGKMVLEHLAIFSQNLVVLWAIVTQNDHFSFKLYDIDNQKLSDNTKPQQIHKTSISLYSLEGKNQNITAWQQFSNLWTALEGKPITAALGNYFDVQLEENEISLKMNFGSEGHTFLKAAEVSCNDYERMLSFIDTEFSIAQVIEILNKKPFLLPMALDLIHCKVEKYDHGYRIHELNNFLLKTDNVELALKHNSLPVLLKGDKGKKTFTQEVFKNIFSRVPYFSLNTLIELMDYESFDNNEFNERFIKIIPIYAFIYSNFGRSINSIQRLNLTHRLIEVIGLDFSIPIIWDTLIQFPELCKTHSIAAITEKIGMKYSKDLIKKYSLKTKQAQKLYYFCRKIKHAANQDLNKFKKIINEAYYKSRDFHFEKKYFPTKKVISYLKKGKYDEVEKVLSKTAEITVIEKIIFDIHYKRCSITRSLRYVQKTNDVDMMKQAIEMRLNASLQRLNHEAENFSITRPINSLEDVIQDICVVELLVALPFRINMF